MKSLKFSRRKRAFSLTILALGVVIAAFFARSLETSQLHAASSAIPAVAQDDSTVGTDARSANQSVAPSTEPVDLTSIYERLNRASKEGDLDAMRKLVDECVANDKTPALVKCQLADAYCDAQIDLLAQKGDLEGVKAFCKELRAKANDPRGLAFYQRFNRRLERVAIYAPILAQELRMKFSGASVSFHRVPSFSFMPNDWYDPIFGAAPTFPPDLLNVEPGRSLEEYRKRFKRFAKERERFDVRVRNYRFDVDRTYETPYELAKRINEAEIKIAREIMRVQKDLSSPDFMLDYNNYLNTLNKIAPSNKKKGATVDEALFNECLDELKGFESVANIRVGSLHPIEPWISDSDGFVPLVVEIERYEARVYGALLQERFNSALQGSDVEREEFLDDCLNQLRKRPRIAASAVDMVKTALDADRSDFAEAIARVVKKIREETKDDPLLKRADASIARALRTPSLASTVGQKLEITGVDVNFNDFNLESFRGKYVVVFFRPQNLSADSNWRQTADAFKDLAQNADSTKIAFLEYARTIGDDVEPRSDLNLKGSLPQKALKEKRANPWTTVAADLSERANRIFDATNPTLFRAYRISGAQLALVDPQGVVVAVDSAPQRVQQRLQNLLNDEKQDVQ